MIRRVLCLLIISYGYTFLQFTSAQVVDSVDLEEVEVYSTRLSQTIAESGRNISVILPAQIKNFPVTSMDDMLRYISGIESDSRGLFGVQSDISMRGSTFSQVLVLVDGMRINDPLTAHFNNNIPVPLSEIERVEILRGPAAAIYGADAVGGVIHFITKTFSTKRELQGFMANGKISGGGNELFSAEAGFTFNQKKFTISAGLQNSSTNGQKLESGNRNDFNMRQYILSAGIDLGKGWYTAIRSGYDFRNFDARYFYTISPYDESREQVKGWWNQFRLSHQGKKHLSELNVNYNTTEDSFLFSPATAENIHTTSLVNLQFSHNINFSTRFKITGGIQSDWRSIESTDRGNHNDYHFGVYGTAYYSPVKKIGITGSLRMDFDENYGTEILPQINATWMFNNFLIRAATGRSIRAADYTERYISRNIPGILAPGRNIGNPDLKAETAWSFEAGTDIFLSPGLTLKTTVFTRYSQNLIDYVLTYGRDISYNVNLDPDAQYFYTQNISELRTSGIETEIQLKKHFSNVNGEFLLGHVYINSDNPSGEKSKYISGHAKHLVTGNFTLGISRFVLSINGIYKLRDKDAAPDIEAWLNEDYFVLNGKAEAAILKDRLFGFVQVW